MSRKIALICIDRDGTLIYDDKYHLGRTNAWRNKIKILPQVVAGIKQLRKIPHARIYLITNQPGVAVNDFPLLTLERAHKVSQEVLRQFEERGARFDGYFICPHASPAYVKRRPGRRYDQKLICNCSCIKPRLGMVFNALKSESITRKDARVYVLGDRLSDVKTGAGSGGRGILIPFENESGEEEKTRSWAKRYKKEKYIAYAKSFSDAVRMVREREVKT